MSETRFPLCSRSVHVTLALSVVAASGLGGCVFEGNGAALDSITIGVGAEAKADSGAIRLNVHQKQQLGLRLTYDDGFEELAPSLDEVTWSTDDDSIARFEHHGKLLGERRGTTGITAKFRDLTASIDVEVMGVPQSLRVRADRGDVATGLSLLFAAELQYKHGETIDVTDSVEWSSSAVEVATIDQNGVATGVAVGNTVIRANGYELTGDKNLQVRPAVVLSIEVSPQTVELQVQQLANITAIGTFSDGNVVDITSSANWESSNSAVVRTRSKGEIEALAPGQATISAKKDNVQALVAVTVVAAN
ncbi:MAG: Ig-like domain-containing protein [Proteobacteria bacterium]|nr:Ig-like domain-containing protein [Pseudomonadota bacterium]